MAETKVILTKTVSNLGHSGDVAPYTSGRHARRRPFRTSYGLILEKTKNRNLSIPVVCAPAGIRTLDTLIMSQLL